MRTVGRAPQRGERSDARGVASVVELALLVAAIIAAVVASQVYLKRSVEGRLRNAAESISDAHYLAGSSSGSSNMTMNVTQRQTVISGEDERAGDVGVAGLIANAAPVFFGSTEAKAQDFNVFVESRTTETTTTQSNVGVNE